MSFRAPQYRRVITGIRSKPIGPNPAAAKGLRVEQWANIFALVDGLGVISPYRTEAEAKAAHARQQSVEAKESAPTPNPYGQYVPFLQDFSIPPPPVRAFLLFTPSFVFAPQCLFLS